MEKNSKSVKMFLEGTKNYNKLLENNEYGRYKSWEHCYEAFYNAFYTATKLKKQDYDYLSLHLAFYLASWGMYRGSSFLLNWDYKIHEGAVKIIVSKKYKDLCGIECGKIGDKQISLILHLKNELENYYKKFNSKKCITDTLSSKILLGTLGCVPAFDRFFKAGLCKIDKSIPKTFNKKAIEKLCEFYSKNKDKINDQQTKNYVNNNLIYPQMKILDMGFWEVGYKNEMFT